jgi:hypothetical protein
MAIMIKFDHPSGADLPMIVPEGMRGNGLLSRSIVDASAGLSLSLLSASPAAGMIPFESRRSTAQQPPSEHHPMSKQAIRPTPNARTRKDRPATIITFS